MKRRVVRITMAIAAQPQFRITLNWFEELKQRIPVK